MFLLHVNKEAVVDRIDVRHHEIPPNVPYELPDYDGRAIMEHLWWAGLVEVAVIKDGYKTDLDVETARRAAHVALQLADEKIVADYIENQRTDRLARNAPALPPTGRSAEAIKRQGTDLSAYGLNPIGYKAAEKTKEIEDQLAQSREENRILNEKFERLMARFDSQSTKVNPPQDPVTERHPDADPQVQTPNQRRGR